MTSEMDPSVKNVNPTEYDDDLTIDSGNRTIDKDLPDEGGRQYGSKPQGREGELDTI